MAKFIQPPEIQKLPKQSLFEAPLMWPLGTLYQHTESGLHFRFLKLGGRWDTTYAISTEKGTFSLAGFNVGRIPVTGDKNFITAKFIQYLKDN